jgi:Family of unknown function (DUF6544)
MNTIATPHIELRKLPDRVHDYLARVLPEGGATPSRVRLTQEGTIQRKVDGNPLPFHAVEEIDVHEVAFSWEAGVRLSKILPRLHVVDRFAGGKGFFRATMLGVPVSRGVGEETSIGEAMRYLAELPWAPYAMLNPQLHWHVIDESIVEVETRVGSETASIAIRFNEAGDVIAAFGHRPHREGKRFEPRSWVGLYSDYQELGGVRIPTRGEVHWTLPDGPFRYFRGTITGVELS